MSTLTRRELLQCVGASGLVAAGCSDDPVAPVADAATSDLGGGADAGFDAGADAGAVVTDAGTDAARDIPRADAETRSGIFLHGVASGDPLADAVILWTRVTLPEGMTGDVAVTWELSRTVDFAAVAAMGTFTTNAARDYTVKVDATALAAGTTFYYRFRANGMTSPVGRTRTAGTGAVDRLRLAVVSCASMAHGFFHTYRALAGRLDLDAVVHLGDYIYEYGSGDYGTLRGYDPPTEIRSLADYRRRHAHYKRDADLRAAHQQHPFITVWDDHEFADNSWEGGAQKHDPATEGAWADRKAAAEQAYFEWMPIREQQGDRRIYRRLQFGSLVDLVMIDSRIWGRQLQTVGMNPPFNDPARTLLGAAQEQWFLGQIMTSTARWKLVGQQVMMGQLPQFLNTDAWDGYPAARSRFFALLRTMMVNDVVVLTGDIHSSWAMDLTETPTDTAAYDPATGRGSLAVEFVTPAITSPGFPPGVVTNAANALLPSNRHMKYWDLVRRGYVILDVTPTRLQGAFFHYEHGATFAPEAATDTFSAAWSTVPGRNHLERDTMAAAARADAPAAAPAESA
ncbi:MAG: phoD [Myxococcaceae bacterium]|nr:phoD [Myxococcaceae bacterium]